MELQWSTLNSHFRKPGAVAAEVGRKIGFRPSNRGLDVKPPLQRIVRTIALALLFAFQ